jgi:NOL1/NOP2/fmu family ribosome biogenesis protein
MKIYRGMGVRRPDGDYKVVYLNEFQGWVILRREETSDTFEISLQTLKHWMAGDF